jgi:hypothetical protein
MKSRRCRIKLRTSSSRLFASQDRWSRTDWLPKEVSNRASTVMQSFQGWAGIYFISCGGGCSCPCRADHLPCQPDHREGSVTGFIQTNGTTGVLTGSDFINWDLLLNDGKNTFRLTGPLSGNNSQVFLRGEDVAAFDNSLFFNFSGIDYGTLLFSPRPFTGMHYYCDSSQPYICIPGETVVPLNLKAGYQNVRLHGNVAIGVADSVPESGTLGLLLNGCGWLARRLRVGFAN